MFTSYRACLSGLKITSFTQTIKPSLALCTVSSHTIISEITGRDGNTSEIHTVRNVLALSLNLEVRGIHEQIEVSLLHMK